MQSSIRYLHSAIVIAILHRIVQRLSSSLSVIVILIAIVQSYSEVKYRDPAIVVRYRLSYRHRDRQLLFVISRMLIAMIDRPIVVIAMVIRRCVIAIGDRYRDLLIVMLDA
ncbi:hypothetical protein Tco_0738203 [Tanacetum coccineum]